MLKERASHGSYVSPITAEWMRARWSRWLRWKTDKYAISVRKLALRLVEPESKSDYRGAVRAWMSGTRTIDAENAFALGEALGELSDKWISGPLAVVIAGHYHDFMLLLIPVGTSIAARPPGSSGRAAFPHPAPILSI